jgi:hypothetical protein
MSTDSGQGFNSRPFLRKNHNGMMVWFYPQPEAEQPKPTLLTYPMPRYPVPALNLPYLGLPRIFHAAARHEKVPNLREKAAWDSWDTLYRKGYLIPSHYWHYKRNAVTEVGDSRYLPYLKDVLAHALDEAQDSDIILWTNDDNILHPKLPEMLHYHIREFGPCTATRTEFLNTVPSLELPPEIFDQSRMSPHPGRDLLAATKKWYQENWDLIPDFILGCSMFDSCLALLVRRHYGLTTSYRATTYDAPLPPAELPRGYVAHLYHQPHWGRPNYETTSPGQRHNSQLGWQWVKKYGSE